ncbi:MAG: sulfatase [Dehalococcoidia bacterium]|nr:sulfatase [Dehalococcoidia bacterium]
MTNNVKLDAPNVILITIDSLRYDHLGCYGYHRNTSPNIDALATRGVKFMQAISNGGQTPQAFPSIIASALPPIELNGGKAILRRSVTLAQIFKKYSYHTAAFHSNPNLSHFLNYNRGFDLFDDSLWQSTPKGLRLWVRNKAKSAGGFVAKVADRASILLKPVFSRVLSRPIISAEEITDKALSWHKSHGGSCFLWLHYMDVHHPYMPTAKYLSQFYHKSVSRRQMNILWRKMLHKPEEISITEKKILVDLYDAEIKYTDEVIGSLLSKLGNRLDNTIVIVTADHGDEFGEHGRFGHNTVYDELLHVPLIIAGPGVESDVVVENQVSLIDLAPTVTDLLGIENPRSFKGESLLPTIEDQDNGEVGTISTYICSLGLRQRNIAYRIPGWKYICTESLNDGCLLGEEVYDLRSDPGETNNLHGVGNEGANRFELEARKKIAQFKHLKAEGKTDYEKATVKAKMRSLKKSDRI